MKRFLFITALIAVLLGVMLYFTPQSTYAEALCYADFNPVVSIYCRYSTCSYTDLGLGCEVTCSVKELKGTLKKCKDVDGISVTFGGSERDVENVLNRLHAKVVSVQRFDGLYVACAYSSRLQGGVSLDCGRVNLQIAYRNGAVTVGYPLILGSY